MQTNTIHIMRVECRSIYIRGPIVLGEWPLPSTFHGSLQLNSSKQNTKYLMQSPSWSQTLSLSTSKRPQETISLFFLFLFCLVLFFCLMSVSWGQWLVKFVIFMQNASLHLQYTGERQVYLWGSFSYIHLYVAVAIYKWMYPFVWHKLIFYFWSRTPCLYTGPYSVT